MKPPEHQTDLTKIELPHCILSLKQKPLHGILSLKQKAQRKKKEY
jgi:hypothetical protein